MDDAEGDLSAVSCSRAVLVTVENELDDARRGAHRLLHCGRLMNGVPLQAVWPQVFALAGVMLDRH
jgi:hypothetical protein